MAVKVWIGENLDRRHEQEQVKEFLLLMHAFYDSQPGTVHVLCNFICGGCQIDAAVVKPDAFIPIEFKTAGGPVSGSENGRWRLQDPDTYREIPLGGGSHASNPYNQVANARTAIAQKLESHENDFFRPHESERVSDWRHFVHGLVVLAPNLSEGVVDEIDVDFYAKPWFDYCRIRDVAESVSKTTTRDGELSNKNILKIISNVLHLEEAEMRDGVPMLPGGAVSGDVQDAAEKSEARPFDDFGLTLGGVFADLDCSGVKNPAAQKPLPKKNAEKGAKRGAGKAAPQEQVKQDVKIQENLEPPKDKFVAAAERILSITDPQVKLVLESVLFLREDLPEYVEGGYVVCGKDNATELPVSIDGDWDYVIELKYKGDAKRALSAVNEYCSWQYTHPYVSGDVIVWRFPEANAEKNEMTESPVTLQGIGFLPPAIEEFILEHPYARYSPDALTASSNLNADMQRVQWYLGNYFPRSFCETFAIFDYIFAKRCDEMKIDDKLSILDVGIGSGGATCGLIWALRKWFKDRIREINVVGFDGNAHALELCGELSCVLTSRWNVTLNVQTSNIRISKETMGCVAQRQFDFILASKAIQEMDGKFCHNDYVSLASSALKPTGVGMLLEIFSPTRQSQIKSSLRLLGADARILVSSVESRSGAAFGVISNLTTQLMEEAISFVAWGGKGISAEESPEVEVACHRPRK